MRRRIQAVGAAGQHRCNGAISLRLTRNGRSGPAVGPSDGGEPQISARIKGPFHGRLSRTVGSPDTVDTFSVYVTGAEETDVVEWFSPVGVDGVPFDNPGLAVVFTDAASASTTVELTYSSGITSSSVNVGVFVNGNFFVSNVLYGSIYGA